MTLSPELIRQRDIARVRGRFGVQEHTAPDPAVTLGGEHHITHELTPAVAAARSYFVMHGLGDERSFDAKYYSTAADLEALGRDWDDFRANLADQAGVHYDEDFQEHFDIAITPYGIAGFWK